MQQGNQKIAPGRQAENILDRRQAEGEGRSRTNTLERLNELSSRLWQQPSLLEGLNEILASTIELLHADMGNCQLLTEKGKTLAITAQRGFKPDFLDFFREVSVEDESACGRALRSGARVIIEDVETDALYEPLRPIARSAGYRAVVSTPLISRGGKPLGMLSTHWRGVHRPSEQDLQGLDLHVRQAVDFIIDITEQKRAEQALAEKEERLRAALTASGTGTFRWNIQTNALDWDENLDRLFGLIPGQTVRSLESFISRVHPDERPGVIKRCEGCAREGADFDMEFRVVWPDGSVHWLDDKGKTFFDDQGRPSYMTGACMEITARKKSEQALRESEERYRALFESMDEGYCIIEVIFDPGARRAVDYRFLEVNPAFETQAGMRDVVGKRMLEFVPSIEEHWLNNYGQVALTGEPIRFANEYKTLHRWFDVYAFRVGPPNSRRVAVLFTDITQRKRAEEELRRSRERFDLVRDGAQVGFWFCDLPFDELIWDTRVKEHFWLAPDAKVTIDTFYKRIHPDDRERTRAAIAASIANHTRYDIEYRTVSAAHGQTKWVRAIGRTFYNEDGQPIRFDGVTLDITQNKRAEAVLHQIQAELVAANHQLASRAEHLESLVQQRTAKLTETIGELEGFSYSITHDMRAPLRAVNSFANVLAADYADKLDDDAKRLLDRISRAVSRMDKLIQDVLQYSKVLRMDLKLEPVHAARLVAGILESYPDFQEPQATVVVDGELPEVLANEAALTQCFSNLLYNAVKFVPAGIKPRVTISAETKESSVRFWVQDNGIGIEANYLENIFGLFQRLTNQYEGTGVGLSIVRKAVERMGGRAGAESEPGQGSRFWFELNRSGNHEKT